ncbi:MAG: ABC transporter permease [Acidobacteriota bacterium]
MDLLRDTWYLFIRLVRINRRMPVFLLLSIMQPVLWMLLFGQLFTRVTSLPGFEAESYIQFIAPGIAIMTALFSAAYSGLSLLKDIEGGFLDRLIATPVSRGALVASRVLMAAGQVVLQAAIILVMSFALGARPHGGLLGLLGVFFPAALLAASFASVSCGMALITRRQELVIAAMNFIVLPLTFLSSMIMTRNLMPGWIRTVTRFNPVDWAVTVSRHSFEGQLDSELVTSLALLLTCTLGCALFATHAFKRYQKTM